MTATLSRISEWASFHKRLSDPLHGRVSCRLGGELFPFALPQLDPLELLDQARNVPQARILRQSPGARVDESAKCHDYIRGLSITQAAAEPLLHLTLFDLAELCRPGCVLHKMKSDVFEPLEDRWRSNGLKWDGRLWPILFIGGSMSASNYHVDPTPNMTWHLFGAKRYYGLKEPDRWCPPSVKKDIHSAIRPDNLSDADCICHDNAPGDLVWIPIHTPHWVNAGSFSATITFAFKNLEVRQFAAADRD